MNETVNQEINAEETIAEEQRTFTQAEVDVIVGERLKRERGKYADYDALKEKADKLDAMEEANKTALEKATEKAAALQSELDSIKKANDLRTMREKIAEETGVPASLITAETEEDAKKQAESILSFAKPAYPSVRDGGEVRVSGGKTTRQQFVEWFNKL